MQMSARREALKYYFLEVVRDLVMRGVLSRQQGQPLEEILQQEAARVFAEIQLDFASVGIEVGVGLVGGLEKMLYRKLGELFWMFGKKEKVTKP